MANLKEFTAFIMDNGFIWGPSPEIYGGMAGFYDYAPLGKLLKNNVENVIRKTFTKYDFWEVECPTIMPAQVWKASGHLGGFSDPMIQCSHCSSEYRVDKLLEEHGITQAANLNKEQSLEIIAQKNIVCTSCNSKLKNEIQDHSLMMKTTVGTDMEAYNRPETATTTYLPFKRFDQFFRKKYPFSVFQIGKAYRNEISPRQMVMRGREFTQAEGQIFLFEKQKHNFPKYEKIKEVTLPFWFNTENQPTPMTLDNAMKNGRLKNKAYAWSLTLAFELFSAMGIPEDRMRLRQHTKNEMAFYADDAWDVEINTNSYGWVEVCGIHDRTDYDLNQHMKYSKQKLTAFNDETQKQEVPHVLEIAFGTDRPAFALLDIFYDDSDSEHRILKLPSELAPVQVAIFPLVNKLKDQAQEIHDVLKLRYRTQFDTSGAIGRRYYRADEIGIPLAVTFDFESLDDSSVTIRNRDSQKQIRVKIKNLNKEIDKFLSGDISSFDK